MLRSTFIFDFIRFLRAARFPLPHGSGNRHALRDSAFGSIPSLTFRSLGNESLQSLPQFKRSERFSQVILPSKLSRD